MISMIYFEDISVSRILFLGAHQQILDQSLDVFRSLGRRRIVRCQLDKCGQEIFTLLDILLHFLRII